MYKNFMKLAIVVLVCCLHSVKAQETTRLIVPFAPGGPTDQITRLIASELTKLTGKPAIVENKPGAGGTIAAQYVVKAKPDGSVYLVGSPSVLVINQGLQKTLPYDPEKDFVPVSGMTRSPLIFIVKGDSALENIQQLVTRAKTLKNLMPMGSAGNGTIPHLAGTYFNQQAGISALHVPFNGVAPALLSLLSGDTIYMFDTLSTSIENIKAGKVKGLGIASDKRFSGLPEIATLAEQGYAVQASSWFGLVAPAKTPQATVVAMNQAINSILTAADFSNKMAAMGIETMPGSVDQFTAFIEAERARWLPEVTRLNLSAE